SFFRPERYVIYALQSSARLEAALAAALVTSAVLPASGAPDVEKLAGQLARTVPAPVLEHVAALARKHPAALGHAGLGPAGAAWARGPSARGGGAGSARPISPPTGAAWSWPATSRPRRARSRPTRTRRRRWAPRSGCASSSPTGPRRSTSWSGGIWGWRSDDE